jgi:uncharacterized Zn ribbon protein
LRSARAGISFRSKEPRAKEETTMQEQNQMTCPQCGRSFDSQEELDKHTREEHGMGDQEQTQS